MLKIKVIIENGCVTAALKNQSTPVELEVVVLDKDYEDLAQLRGYLSALCQDPSLQEFDFKTADFRENKEERKE